MWEAFSRFVQKEYTITRIRAEMLSLGYDLSSYSDVTLLRKMLGL